MARVKCPDCKHDINISHDIPVYNWHGLKFGIEMFEVSVCECVNCGKDFAVDEAGATE